ncbi:DUF192 domain-containing protein [Rhodobacteraceae bacterium SC52]|nr:DUF192 domain-containing protein [Rhodobacteraceae bacterium SC52]
MRHLFGAAVLALAAFAAGPVLAECAPDRVDLRGDWGTARFSVEVADTADERSQGLMHRESMPRGAGMLFVYDKEQSVSFWMRNTLIPLDMIFADSAGIVRRVHENAIPLDETGIRGGSNIQYVLEINGGLSARFGINPGTELRHIALGDGAAWPCE